VRARRFRRAPDPSAVADEAIRRFGVGETERALAMLDRLIADSPWFWQARQYRGEMRLRTGDAAGALADFDAAIRLAPEEAHLRELREQAANGPIRPSPDGSS
jgi:predicted Zn-dependent protease